MTQRLYINGELVDITADTKITLNFKSNIFGDISKITSSNSQTVKLPKTTRNCRIFDNATAPAYSSRFRYKRHTCRYEQNGVELLRGYAVLLDSSADYEIALYWGVMAKYQSWVDANPSLQELDGTEYMAWNSAITTTELYSTIKGRGYGYPYYDSGVYDKNKANMHPSALCSWVLDKISTQQGITFTFPERVQEVLDNLAMPCLTNNAGEMYWLGYRVQCQALMATTGASLVSEYAYLQATNISAGSDMIVGDVSISGGIKWTEFDTKGADTIRVVFKDYTAGKYSSLSLFQVQVLSQDGDTERSYSFAPTVISSSVYGFDIAEDINVSGAQKVRFAVAFTALGVGASSWTAGSFRYTPLVEENTYPCLYDIIPNLPDISQIDFIKALCAMFGLFAMPDLNNPDTLLFVGIDEVMSNKEQAYDWTTRLLEAQGGDAQQAKFSIADYAQKNWFRYAEDDTVSVDADYPITIANEALEREKDAVTLPFAATRGNSIAQYDKKLEDGNVTHTLQSVKPRIMLMNDSSGYARLSFVGLSFKDLIGTYYARYADMLNAALVIKEKLHLDEYDIVGLDFTKPVYLAQYSRYFGIVSLQVSGNECTAELALLPTTIVES